MGMTQQKIDLFWLKKDQYHLMDEYYQMPDSNKYELERKVTFLIEKTLPFWERELAYCENMILHLYLICIEAEDQGLDFKKFVDLYIDSIYFFTVSRVGDFYVSDEMAAGKYNKFEISAYCGFGYLGLPDFEKFCKENSIAYRNHIIEYMRREACEKLRFNYSEAVSRKTDEKM